MQASSASDADADATATVAITVLNVNEAPVFATDSYAFDLAENQDGSDTAVDVGMVSATDTDEGDTVTYSIMEGGDSSLFAIDADSGAITYVGSGEDLETQATRTITVHASDGSLESAATVTVNVTGANDNSPAWTFDEGKTFYEFMLHENADGSETAVAVGTVAATDADGDAVSYSISAGNDDGLFAIDADSGAITYVGMGEDYESTMSHSLTVRASDGSTYVEAKADVMVQDANDAPMQSDAEVSDFLALAGQEQEITVDLKALFSDQDGDALSYSLSSNAPSWMSFVVVLEGAGDDQKVTGIISGTAPAGKDAEVLGVAVVATDGDGATGEAMFDVIVDAENSAPSKLEFMPTDTSDNTLITSATLDENSEGTELARVKVTDSDPAGHPHGQHVFSFMLGGELTTKFEVTDAGVLKLKDGESLDHEAYTGGEVTLRVTASDMAVDDPNGPADDSTVDSGSSPASTVGSISRDFTLKITDTGDAPAAGTVGDWYVTVDEDLDAEDVRKGDWLAFGLQTEKAKDKDPAFTDPDDGDTLTYSLTTAPAWLQIDSSSGDMANKAGMLPENGVYDVTVTATDSTDKSASASFQIAVIIADPDGSDNDEPDIRGVRDYDYTEGSGVQKVAEFTVQDDDLPYSPHPYGKLTVELSEEEREAVHAVGPHADRRPDRVEVRDPHHRHGRPGQGRQAAGLRHQ